jgi:hydroxymethylglutaryl-CoA lyase
MAQPPSIRPDKIRIVEVGPRDGLQNEKNPIATGDKIALIQKLSETGLRDIEITSFVSPKAIPQLADNQEVAKAVFANAKPGVSYWALVPNIKGMENAIAAGVKHVAVFTAASETFNQRNINKSIAEALEAFRPVVSLAKQEGIIVRGYVSTAFWCPYEGKISPQQLLAATEPLLNLGVDEISIGDTIGKAIPDEVRETVLELLKIVPLEKLAMHFHDTYQHALANIEACLDFGISIYDSSVAGLGGCPYAPGASGNVSTEAVVRLMDRLGIQTGVNQEKLSETVAWVNGILAR